MAAEMQRAGALFCTLCLVLSMAGANAMQPVGRVTFQNRQEEGALGIFYLEKDVQDHEGDYLKKALLPGMKHSENFFDKNRFELRTEDFHFRARLELAKAESGDYSHQISFENLMGDTTFELKHSTGGFQWINAKARAAHLTDMGHEFEIRDRNRNPIVSLFIGDPFDREL